MAQQYGNSGGLTVKVGGPYGTGGSSNKVAEVTLNAQTWKGATSPYSQVVEIEVVSVNSKVDLSLDVAQLESLRANGTALTAENNEGVVTIYAIGNKPTVKYTVQATVTEVVL